MRVQKGGGQVGERSEYKVIVSHKFIGDRQQAERGIGLWAQALLQQWFEGMRQGFQSEEAAAASASEGN